MKIIRNILFLIIILVLIAIFAMDSIIKFAIQKYGSEALKSEVVVDIVDVSLLNKEFNVVGLNIDNPEGFAGDLFVLDKLKIKVNEFKDDLIIIDSLILSGIDVSFIQQGKNINLLALKNSLATNDDTQQYKSSPSDLRIRIDKFKMEDIKLNIDTVLLKNDLVVPTIDINNFGGTNGVSIEQFSSYILDLLIDRAQNLIKTQGIDAIKKNLEEKVQEQLIEKVSDKIGIDPNIKEELEDQVKSKTEDFKQKVDGIKEDFEKLKKLF